MGLNYQVNATPYLYWTGTSRVQPKGVTQYDLLPLKVYSACSSRSHSRTVLPIPSVDVAATKRSCTWSWWCTPLDEMMWTCCIRLLILSLFISEISAVNKNHELRCDFRHFGVKNTKFAYRRVPGNFVRQFFLRPSGLLYTGSALSWETLKCFEKLKLLMKCKWTQKWFEREFRMNIVKMIFKLSILKIILHLANFLKFVIFDNFWIQFCQTGEWFFVAFVGWPAARSWRRGNSNLIRWSECLRNN